MARLCDLCIHIVVRLKPLSGLYLNTSHLLVRKTMAEGQLFKPEKDYTKEADKQIPQAEELAKSNNVQAALEKLSALEKHARQVRPQAARL